MRAAEVVSEQVQAVPASMLDGTRLVGIVTVTDLLRLGRGIDRPARPQRRRANHRVAHRKSRGAFGVW